MAKRMKGIQLSFNYLDIYDKMEFKRRGLELHQPRFRGSRQMPPISTAFILSALATDSRQICIFICVSEARTHNVDEDRSNDHSVGVPPEVDRITWWTGYNNSRFPCIGRSSDVCRIFFHRSWDTRKQTKLQLLTIRCHRVDSLGHGTWR